MNIAGTECPVILIALISITLLKTGFVYVCVCVCVCVIFVYYTKHTLKLSTAFIY